MDGFDQHDFDRPGGALRWVLAEQQRRGWKPRPVEFGARPKPNADGHPVSACKTCGASVTWCVTEQGKPIPVDSAPVANGNLVIEARDRKLYARAAQPLFDPPTLKRYVAHFATCPEAAQHRKPR